MSFTDVKGYYRTLGLTPEADGAAVKTAYRARAKEAHPDAGGSGGEGFHRLADAYAVLSDANRRADYDAVCISAALAREAAAWREPEPDAAASPKSAAASPESEAPRRDRDQRPALEPARCCRCGVVSAQPRFVRFHRVVGALNRSHRRVEEGVFCRACADKAALRASLATWLLGWWSLPRGPADTVRALLRNLAGGDMPAARNADMLTRQAHAFAARGRPALAGILAVQAAGFRPDASLTVLIRLAEGRALKSRWRIGGIAFILQALPIGLAVAWLAVRLVTWSAGLIAG